jgi:hypothetical protein
MTLAAAVFAPDINLLFFAIRSQDQQLVDNLGIIAGEEAGKC